MRLRRLAVLAGILFLAFSTCAQQTSTTNNAQALSILTQSLNAMGGPSAINSIEDYTETGNITYNWAGAQVQATAKVQSMGVTTFRIDSNLSTGTRTWAVDGTAGVLISPDGTRQNSAFYNLTTTGSLTLPILRVASILQSTSTSVSYVGQSTINGHSAYQIHCVVPTASSTLPALTALGVFDLYIDTTSFLVVNLQETTYSESNFHVSFAHEIDFGDYQTAGGIAAPFLITELVNSQPTWSISLNSLAFNSGLTESVFTP